MYIHSYQIHNVLNVYRKQLSQPTSPERTKAPTPDAYEDRINISADGQRQSIFDKISSEIVDRITQFNSTAQFESIINEKLSLHTAARQESNTPINTEFSYNVIDEQNRKITNTLPLQRLNPLAQFPDSANQTAGTERQQNEKEQTETIRRRSKSI